MKYIRNILLDVVAGDVGPTVVTNSSDNQPNALMPSEFSEWALNRAKKYLCGLTPAATEEEVDEAASTLLQQFPTSSKMRGILIGLVIETITETISVGFDAEEVR